MWKELKYYFLVKIYRILVVKVYTIDRAAMSTYHKFHTFCDLSFMTNNGQLSFSFKEDRRSTPRGLTTSSRSISSYLVELSGPALDDMPDSPLHNKVIVAVMIRTKHVNYEALARFLIILYSDQFPSKAT